MANTEYHDQTKPTPGGSRDTWGEENNDLWDYYDALIERRNTLANRPAASDVPDGALYRVDSGDEQGAVFVEDSDSWTKLPVDVDAAHVASQLDIPVYSDDSNAPNETNYFHDGDNQLKYKDSSGTVHAASGGTDTHTDVSDGGSTVVSDVDDINFDTNLDVTDDGDDTVTVTASVSDESRAYTAEGSVALDDSTTDNDRYRIPVYLQDTWAVDWAWAGISLSDGSTDSNVKLYLRDSSGTDHGSIAASSHPNIVDMTRGTDDYTASDGDERVYFVVQNEGSNEYSADTTNADAVEYQVEWEVTR